ncbi:MAG TPA: alpha/beta hydrolase, partial [Brevundimonas sp.]
MNRRGLLAAGAALALPWTPGDDARDGWTPDQFHAARQFVDLPGGRVAFVELGSGPAAIFLHGYPLNGFQWRGAMARLSPHRRCVAPDL